MENPTQTIKRTADEGENLNDANNLKKARTDSLSSATGVSKVIHVRNVPTEATESDLFELAKYFGRTINAVIFKGNQGLIEMETADEATRLLEYYSTTTPHIRGRIVYLQYSNRDEISKSAEPPNNILLISVLNTLYPVTLDALQQVFSREGKVEKIIIFEKSGTFQALIQYRTVEEAVRAKKNLDGQNIYSGCCLLRIRFSQVQGPLQVRANNDKMRDFTDSSLPTVPIGSSHPPSASPYGFPSSSSQRPSLTPLVSAIPPYDPSWAAYGNFTPPYPMGVPPTAMGSSVCLVSNLVPSRTSPDVLFKLFSLYGYVERIKILFNQPEKALVQYSLPLQAQLAIQRLNGLPLFGQRLAVGSSKYSKISVSPNPSDEESGKYFQDFTQSNLHRFSNPQTIPSGNQVCEPSPTLHLSNLPLSTTEETLAALFRPFGHLLQVKFIRKSSAVVPTNPPKVEKRMALLQFSTVNEAAEALLALHNHPLETGSGDSLLMKVAFSHQKTIT